MVRGTITDDRCQSWATPSEYGNGERIATKRQSFGFDRAAEFTRPRSATNCVECRESEHSIRDTRWADGRINGRNALSTERPSIDTFNTKKERAPHQRTQELNHLTARFRGVPIATNVVGHAARTER